GIQTAEWVAAGVVWLGLHPSSGAHFALPTQAAGATQSLRRRRAGPCQCSVENAFSRVDDQAPFSNTTGQPPPPLSAPPPGSTPPRQPGQTASRRLPAAGGRRPPAVGQGGTPGPTSSPQKHRPRR